MEQVAEAGPQELRLRILRFTQLGEFLCRVLDRKDGRDLVGSLLLGRAVILLREIQHLDFLAGLAIKPRADFRPERAFLDQRGEPRGRLEVLVPRIVGQGVGHGLDDVRHGVQAHHVGGAVGRRFRAPDRRAGQRIHRVETELELRGVMHRGKDREHADAVANEVRCVLREYHALA